MTEPAAAASDASGGAWVLAAPGPYRVPLLGSRRETRSVATFRFEAPVSGFAYEPGQFVTVEIEGLDDPRGPSREFTLSSSPTERELAITTKLTGSPFKRRLSALAPGDAVTLAGPFGEFTLPPDRAALLVAGGIGVTPFRSMLRFAADTGSRRPTVLLQSNASIEGIVFRDELEDLERKLPSLTVVSTLTRPLYGAAMWTGETGRIDARMLRKADSKLDRPMACVCGPPGFVSDLRAALVEKLGFPEADVRAEDFPGY